MRVLVVDDDVMMGRGIRMALAPVHVDIATDPLLALGLLPAYDVAIVDVSMPGMRGDTLVRSLRALHGERPRVVLISGRSEDELSDLAAACGANATLMKPFSAASLAAIVAGWD